MSRKRRHRTSKTAKAAAGHGYFQLPPGVSYQKLRVSYGWVYLFRHRTLGELGRIVLQDHEVSHSHLSCEVAGDPADPMAETRRRIFEPLALELMRHMETATGPVHRSRKKLSQPN